MCYAVQLAYDSASDPVYASGWAAGQNGGTGGGFTPWDFDTGYWWPYNQVFYAYGNQAEAHQIDNGLKSGTQFSNPFNDIGTPTINGNNRAWTIARRTTPIPETEGVPRAGRGFPALQTGQTLSVVVDNPAQLPPFNGGFWIRLNSSNSNSISFPHNEGEHGSICQASRPCYYIPNPAMPGKWKKGADPKVALEVMNWNYGGGFGFGYGKVFAIDSAGGTFTGLLSYDTFSPIEPNTADGGMRIDVTLTTATTYDLAITLLSNPNQPAYTRSGTFSTALPIDWIQFDQVGNFSDTGAPPTVGTDFYIRSITISDATPAGVPGDYNNNGKVDGADYVLWRNGGPLQNEVDTPGTVNAADYTAWRARFGNTSGAGAGLAGASVPEPGTFVYLVMSGAGVISIGLRRKPTIRRG